MHTTIAHMSWTGSESSPTGSATYTVDGASMTLELPDFKTANSIHKFLILRAEAAGRRAALDRLRKEVFTTLRKMEDES